MNRTTKKCVMNKFTINRQCSFFYVRILNPFGIFKIFLQQRCPFSDMWGLAFYSHVGNIIWPTGHVWVHKTIWASPLCCDVPGLS